MRRTLRRMTTTRIGWTPLDVALVIKQGSTGATLLTTVVTNADGSALSSYAGWTAKLALYRQPQGTPEITLTPAVVGDAPNKQFLVTVSWAHADTVNAAVGTLVGDVLMISPDGTQDFYSANVTLTIERSFTAP
jgi:hypothetical protein